MYVYMYLTFSKEDFQKLTLTERTKFLFLEHDEKKFKAINIFDENFLVFLRHYRIGQTDSKEIDFVCVSVYLSMKTMRLFYRMKNVFSR